MNLPARLLERFERVLELGEKLLGELVEAEPDKNFFESHRAFR